MTASRAERCWDAPSSAGVVDSTRLHPLHVTAPLQAAPAACTTGIAVAAQAGRSVAASRAEEPSKYSFSPSLNEFPKVEEKKSHRQRGAPAKGRPIWTGISADWRCGRIRPRKLCRKNNPLGFLDPSEVVCSPPDVNNQTIGMDVIINNYTNYC